MNIAEIDRNYTIVPIEGYDFVFYDAMNDVPEMLEGLPFGKLEKEYCRLPQNMLDKVSSGVSNLSWCTAGAAFRFVSDTPAVAVKFVPAHTFDIDNIPLTTRAGLDVYRRSPGAKEFIHCGTLRYNGNTSMQAKNAFLCKNDDGVLYEYLINFPLYGGAAEFAVGVVRGSVFEAAPAHRVKPVLFYGSSITQGSAASRPGMHYCARLCRAVDAEGLNFGFAGNAKGEQNMAELTASLELSAYILDYDHNAPTLEHLQSTHEAFFRTIRSIQPELPVIMMNRPSNWVFGDFSSSAARRDVIYNTYRNARANGDDNVYFIDGETLFAGEDRSDCTSDLTHPNDIGFERMYRTVLPVLKAALKI